MSIFNFGDNVEGINYKVLNEREIRGSSGIMLFLAVIAAINGFILKKYIVIPYIVGFLTFSFFIGVFINPKFSPTMVLAKLLVRKQKPLYFGAVQKRFAWSLGLGLSTTIFVLSFYLLKDETYFDPVCLLCLVCIALLYLESAFGICVGCKLYNLAVALKLIKEPEEKPNCMGDACVIDGGIK